MTDKKVHTIDSSSGSHSKYIMSAEEKQFHISKVVNVQDNSFVNEWKENLRLFNFYLLVLVTIMKGNRPRNSIKHDLLCLIQSLYVICHQNNIFIVALK